MLPPVEAWVVALTAFLCTALLPSLIMGAPQKNVYNDALALCSTDPLTGWYRDGYCNTDNRDGGAHVVCAGNSLSAIHECCLRFDAGSISLASYC